MLAVLEAALSCRELEFVQRNGLGLAVNQTGLCCSKVVGQESSPGVGLRSGMAEAWDVKIYYFEGESDFRAV